MEEGERKKKTQRWQRTYNKVKRHYYNLPLHCVYILDLFLDMYYSFVCICVLVYVPKEVRRVLVPCTWRSRQLWAAWCRRWNQTSGLLQEQYALLNTGHFSSPMGLHILTVLLHMLGHNSPNLFLFCIPPLGYEIFSLKKKIFKRSWKHFRWCHGRGRDNRVKCPQSDRLDVNH